MPYTIGNYLSDHLGDAPVPTDDPVFTKAMAGVADETQRWLDISGTRSVDYFHRELGKIIWDHVGMERTKSGLEKALSEIPALREEFERDVRVPGSAATINSSLEKVGRVADFFELGELMARDALDREESCGGHFRVEHRTEEGEAKRDDESFTNVAAWEWNGKGQGSDETHRRALIRECGPDAEELQVSRSLNLKLRIWRQQGPDAPGAFQEFAATDISEDMSFLEMLDVINEQLIAAGDVPI